MNLLSTTKAAARSWCLVSHHREGQQAEILFGDSQEILGIDAASFTEAAISDRLIGEIVGPCPWVSVVEATVYLVDAGAGRAHWLESSSVPAPDGGLIMSTRPVAFRDSEQLLAIARLSQGGSLLGPLSHELNNVVQGLSSAEYLFRDCVESGDPIELEDLDQLAQVVEHLKTMGAQIQNFARIDQDATAVVSLPLALTRTMELLRGAGRLGLVEVTLTLPDDLPELQWRVAEIHFLLIALLSNAVDAALVGDEAGWVNIIGRSVEGALELEIRNSGARLDFSTDSLPGTTSKNPSRHLGFGLSIARSVVARRGGTLVSTSGDGTGLRATLPLIATAAGA